MDDLSVIFPVYNERNTIERVLQDWDAQLRKLKIPFRIIVCEDGSTDGTSQLLKQLAKRFRLKLLQRPRRSGYASAVIRGILAAQTAYVLCVDSDGQCDPRDVSAFWPKRSEAQVLLGFRKARVDSLSRKLFSLLFKRVFSFLFDASIRDPSCPYVLFRPGVIVSFLDKLTLMREGFWWGFTGCSIKNRLSIKQIPVHHRARFDGQTNVYQLPKIPSIALRNMTGLIRLKFFT